MGINAFTVVSEFKFDVAGAILGTETLQKNVDALSNSVGNAISSVSALGVGFVAQFSGATGGILGILGNAISASDKFRRSQIELANTIVSNKMLIGGATANFEDALKASDRIMTSIVEKAQKLRIDPAAFVEQTKMFSNILGAKGLAGKDLSQASELARVSLKAAPALGVSNDQAQSGILAGVSGQLSANTQFGRRLFLESGKEILASTGIKNLKEFNKAIPLKRVQALIAGLDKLAGSSLVVAERAKTIDAALNNFISLFRGVGSILKPLGDAIKPFLIGILNTATKFLQSQGASIVRTLSSIVERILASPEELLVQMMALESLAGDIAVSAGIVGLILTLKHLKDILSFFGIKGALGGLVGGGAMNAISKGFSLISVAFAKLAPFIMPIVSAVIQLVGLFAILLIPLQGLSRALAQMKIDSLKFLADNSSDIVESMSMFGNAIAAILSPIDDMIDGWKNLFMEIFGGTASLAFITSLFKELAISTNDFAKSLLQLWAGMKGIVAGLAALAGNASQGNFSNIGDTFMGAGADEFQKTMDKFFGVKDKDGKGGIVSANTKIDVTMNNNFKEVLQPDRIAFTIMDQLKKASQNRSGSIAKGSAAMQAGAN